MNRILRIDHSRIVDLLQVFDISGTIAEWAIREQLLSLKVAASPRKRKILCEKSGSRLRGRSPLLTLKSMACGSPIRLMEIESSERYF